MAALGQEIVIGTSPTLIFQCVTEDAYKAMTNPGPNVFIAGAAGDPLPLLLVLPSTAVIYLGGSQVTHTGAGIGAAITGVGSIAYNAIGGDSLYGVVASATQTVSLLALRQSDAVVPAFSPLVHGAAVSTDANVATTAAKNTTGAKIITVGVSVMNGVSGVLTDSASNTWVGRTRKTNVAGVDAQIFDCLSPVTSASHTFTYTTTAGSPGIAMAAFGGPGAPVFDQQNGGVTASGTTVSSGPITPTQAGELVVCLLADNASGTPTISQGFTVTDTLATTGEAFGVGLAYLVQSAAAEVDPTWTYALSTYATAAIASYEQ